MIFEQSWRWYGPNDPVKLATIKQAGAHGVVTALHQIPVGEIWTKEAIKERISQIEESNRLHSFKLHWNVVESLPVHEFIKQGRPERDQLIENYKESIKNLAACGVKTICYNFMPILDWLRTNVRYELEDGSTALLHDMVDVVIFDVYMLQRENAEQSYSDDILMRAKAKYESLSDHEIAVLKQSLLMALPGDKDGFTIEKLKNGLKQYDGISREQLQENLIYFLTEVIPVAEELNVVLAIHPDDPPWPVFGLPRIVSTAEDLKFIFEAVPSVHNGLTFCSGSLGASEENKLTGIIETWYNRIHFVHLRSVNRVAPYHFYEANHLEGSAEMYNLIRKFYECHQKDHRVLPMRPDHGHEMMDDQGKPYYPGYSAIGRLRGLAELRGLEFGIINSLK
ncbi:MAG: mannonate dehydratase [Zunongwangia sp.]|jgi:mannonate dehydratase|uniref:Mannonate dehydratase n=1 Tax=Zunongwangia profunda TaxID=398743 RepID=A0A3D5J1H2_9FLAO|nr:mannonate dehydratase [Zunongwangia profunda]MAC66292.1 mannonate dehydratase [Flavobacteriaceae bacterium]MAO34309.1 mannonate dehydratase [Zunongwangia sp.]MAG88781.1 mannonate dehydratase [Flavobacteriaceae bacterium]MAO34699.1 mannonate dehydratase [Zunongwangia sp.]MAS69083.1 mannonate dehydratase [Zunongwangia sp.]|tara:strand:+ start:1992 stop:3176 length:1185 start_codon:yes stop_codon:yes gene_type:complete